mmetsp:Transcript_81186/g.250571  ORF Transcript_81186/g.250571 Transcript_81186/m.250571 type:complete len:213 (-) Transcript_81186:7-645(-)
MALPGGRPSCSYQSRRASTLMTSRHSCRTRRRARLCCCCSSSSLICRLASPTGTPFFSHSCSKAERGEDSHARSFRRSFRSVDLSAPSSEGRPMLPYHSDSVSRLMTSMLSWKSSLWIMVCWRNCCSSSSSSSPSSGVLSSGTGTPNFEHSFCRSAMESTSQAMAFFRRLWRSFFAIACPRGRPMSSYHWTRSGADIISMLFHWSNSSVAAS